MIGLLLDIENIINLKLLIQNISPVLYNIIFIVIDDNIFDALEQTTKGKERTDFLNSMLFIKNIKYYLYLQYEYIDNSIFIRNCKDEYLELLFKTLNIYFEDTLTLITSNDNNMIKHGFGDPSFCNEGICLTRPNSFIEKTDETSVRYEIEYLKSQENNKYCTITLNIDKTTVDFLKFISTAGVKIGRDNKRSQKEVFGHFNIIKTELKNGGIIHTISLDKNTIEYGDDDNISTNIQKSLYNFHSHPYQAYLKYKTKYGVPSITDYISVYILTTQKNTIVHFVSSLEGLYIISINPESNMLMMDNNHVKDFIEDNMKYKNNIKDLNDYVKFINSFGLFKLNLLKWEEVEGRDITLKFNKIGRNCIIK